MARRVALINITHKQSLPRGSSVIKLGVRDGQVVYEDDRDGERIAEGLLSVAKSTIVFCV